jgi:hypothetical protein
LSDDEVDGDDSLAVLRTILEVTDDDVPVRPPSAISKARLTISNTSWTLLWLELLLTG